MLNISQLYYSISRLANCINHKTLSTLNRFLAIFGVDLHFGSGSKEKK